MDHAPDNELLTFSAILDGFTTSSPTATIVEETTTYDLVKIVLTPKIYTVPINVLNLLPLRDCTGVVLTISASYSFVVPKLNVTTCKAALSWSGYDHAP